MIRVDVENIKWRSFHLDNETREVIYQILDIISELVKKVNELESRINSVESDIIHIQYKRT